MPTRMLLYKSWLDTRWRFLAGILVTSVSACGVALSYPKAVAVLAAASQMPAGTLSGGGPVGDRIAEAVQFAATYRGYVWSQFFLNELPQQWCLFAFVLGTGGIVSQAARGGGLYTLSLPVSRHQLVTARMGVALVELFAIAVVPAVLLTLVSPAVGQRYSLVDALAHGTLLFTGGAVFFCLTFMLSTIFVDLWRPPLLMVLLFTTMLTLRQIFPDLTRYTLAPVITGQAYFQGRAVPWLALSISVSASVILLLLAARNVARRDF